MRQMRVTLRRLDLGMPQQALHLVQATSRVDQKAGVRMSVDFSQSNTSASIRTVVTFLVGL